MPDLKYKLIKTLVPSVVALKQQNSRIFFAPPAPTFVRGILDKSAIKLISKILQSSYGYISTQGYEVLSKSAVYSWLFLHNSCYATLKKWLPYVIIEVATFFQGQTSSTYNK